MMEPDNQVPPNMQKQDKIDLFNIRVKMPFEKTRILVTNIFFLKKKNIPNRELVKFFFN